MSLLLNTMLRLSVKDTGYTIQWEKNGFTIPDAMLDEFLPIPTKEEDLSGPSLAFSCFRLESGDYFVSTVSKWCCRNDEMKRPGISLWKGDVISLPKGNNREGILAACLLRHLLLNERNYFVLGGLVERAAEGSRKDPLQPIFRRFGSTSVHVGRIFDDLRWIESTDLLGIPNISRVTEYIQSLALAGNLRINITAQYPLHDYFSYCCLVDFQSSSQSISSVAGGRLRNLARYGAISSKINVQEFRQTDITEIFLSASMNPVAGQVDAKESISIRNNVTNDVVSIKEIIDYPFGFPVQLIQSWSKFPEHVKLSIETLVAAALPQDAKTIPSVRFSGMLWPAVIQTLANIVRWFWNSVGLASCKWFFFNFQPLIQILIFLMIIMLIIALLAK